MDTIIIGGGASGVMCGIFAKNDSNRVIILERNNTLLKKLLLTGNGRCNYMNEVYSKANYHSQDIDIVDRIISSNNIEMIKEFFDSIGIIPKIKNGYYYPFSNQAISIKKMLEKEVTNRGVEVSYNCLVNKVYKDKDKFIVCCQDKNYVCDNLVIASGSFAYPKTGSDGMGYSFLKSFNHTIIKPLPALVQLESNFKYLKDWDGVRSEVRLELFEDDRYKDAEEGEVQLTKYGISGICTFNLSNYATRGIDLGKKEVIKINFVPFIETLITPWMDKYSKKHKNKKVFELLEGFLNYKLVSIILKCSNINKDKYYNDLSNDEKLVLCKNLRSFPIEITSTKSFDSAQICNGGLKLTEINPNTMESLFVDNLYIIGELLDINGNCGGYNLSSCWISGILAGKDIGDKDA